MGFCSSYMPLQLFQTPAAARAQRAKSQAEKGRKPAFNFAVAQPNPGFDFDPQCKAQEIHKGHMHLSNIDVRTQHRTR